MPNTAEGFYYPDANTNIAPLETVLANMAASSDTVSKQTPRVFANYAAMIAAIPAPTAGRLAVTTQGSGILWQYDGTAAKWVVQNTPTFTNTAAHEAAIPNPTAGVKCVIGSGADYAEYVWTGTAWRASGGSGFVTAEAVLSASVTPGSTLADLGSLGVTVANYGPAAVWEVQANLDVEVVASGAELLDVQLYAAGAAQTGELVAICLTGMAGLRLPLSRTWRVTGMPAGPCTLQLRGYQPTPRWKLTPTHSHMLVRQVA